MAHRILLGVTGSIAAYKAAELVRLLTGRGYQVRVAMSRSACRFVAPLTFQALSGSPVASELLDSGQEMAMGHIELARWADLVLIAPATADCLARLATGRADDVLAAICLATRAPLIVAPAMNSAMWEHPATVANCRILRERGTRILEPEEGELACGETGAGRMMGPTAILARVEKLGQGALEGKRVLVTAGPTREPIDPVRYLGNHSSGKMGFALAEALRDAGAEVTLVSGPVSLPTPVNVKRLDVETAGQMHEAVFAELERYSPEIFVACAAVADYRPAEVVEEKIKKENMNTTLQMELNPDILAEVAALPAGKRPFCVGFAAETRDLLQNAERKRLAKGVDMLAANQVGGERGGFGADENAVRLLWEGGEAELPMMPKTELARRLVELIAEHMIDEPRRAEST